MDLDGETPGRRTALELPRLGLGAGLMAWGLVATLAQYGWVPGRASAWWPLLLIGMGLGKLSVPGRRAGGVFVTGMGVVFLLGVVSGLHLRQTWPLLLVLGGVAMVTNALWQSGAGSRQR